MIAFETQALCSVTAGMSVGTGAVFNLSCFSLQHGLRMHLAFPRSGSSWQLIVTSPKKGIHFYLCAWRPRKHTSAGNPHTDHPPVQPFFPNPLPFSRLKSRGPRGPGLRAGQSAACRGRGLGGCRDAHFAMSARSACEPPDPREQTKPVLRHGWLPEKG